MANDEHVAFLRQGAKIWDLWRISNPDVQPDLTGADLRDADLRDADLRDATLSRANLSGAQLNYADLTRADLGQADLTDASLSRTILDNTNLSEANLTRADLSRAILTRAILRSAVLNEVTLGETVLADIDLSNTKGSDTCRHREPSFIDHRTIQRSGPLPVSFLRGCGLPETFIDYLPSLLNQPTQFYSCFISYSIKDEGFARRLHADLQQEGIRSWFAPQDIKIGDCIRTRIDDAIRIHDKLLVVLSENSINRTWVKEEVETALEKERQTKSTVLFPVRLDAAVMESNTGWAADIKRARHIVDFSGWLNDYKAYQAGLKGLLRGLSIDAST